MQHSDRHGHSRVASSPGTSLSEVFVFDNDDVVQLVTEIGARVEHPDYSRYVDDVDITAVRALYEDLVVVRRIDAEATALQRQGELGLWAPLLGQEAAQVGSARALRRTTTSSPATANTPSPTAAASTRR